MRGWTFSLMAAAGAMVVVCTTGPVRAAGDGEDDEAEVKPVQFGAGLIGAFGGNFLDKPDETHPKYQGATVGLETYPGFGGTSGGAGLMLEARFIGMLGLEIDVIRSSDHGHGDITINGMKSTMTIGQSAWHVPVLAKFVAPLPTFRPMVFAGAEFVMPSSPEGKADTVIPAFWTVEARADSYTMFTGGIGMELSLPIPDVDLRIPFTLRGGYNPSAGDKLDDRATHTITPVGVNTVHIDEVEYKSEWRYQAYATLGVAAYF